MIQATGSLITSIKRAAKIGRIIGKGGGNVFEDVYIGMIPGGKYYNFSVAHSTVRERHAGESLAGMNIAEVDPPNIQSYVAYSKGYVENFTATH